MKFALIVTAAASLLADAASAAEIKVLASGGTKEAYLELVPPSVLSRVGTELAPHPVTISESKINSNSTAISGTTRSYGNNRIFANSSNGTPPTPVGAQSHDLGRALADANPSPLFANRSPARS